MFQADAFGIRTVWKSRLDFNFRAGFRVGASTNTSLDIQGPKAQFGTWTSGMLKLCRLWITEISGQEKDAKNHFQEWKFRNGIRRVRCADVLDEKELQLVRAPTGAVSFSICPIVPCILLQESCNRIRLFWSHIPTYGKTQATSAGLSIADQNCAAKINNLSGLSKILFGNKKRIKKSQPRKHNKKESKFKNWLSG